MTWTHASCVECWDLRHPNRPAVHIREADPETCCFCGSLTRSGIYVRFDPALLTCVHQEATE